MDFRENIKDRLIEDLIGPSKGENEVLFSRPSSSYISGILYPVETKIPLEEQDEENEENTSKDLEDETSKGVSAARKFKPCTAGISFAVLSDSKKPTISIKISFAVYEKYLTFIPFEPERNDNPKPWFQYYWQRKPHRIEEVYELREGLHKIEMEKKGFDNLALFLRTKTSDHGVNVTAQLANNFKPSADSDHNLIEEKSFFQISMKVEPAKDTKFISRQSTLYEGDEDRKISNLIFRNNLEFATGHNCSAGWLTDLDNNCTSVFSTWLPVEEVKPVSPNGDPLLKAAIEGSDISKLSAMLISQSDEMTISACNAIINGYSEWIKFQIIEKEKLEDRFTEQANKNLSRCEDALTRIKNGLNYLIEHPEAMKAFQIANLAMHFQKRWADGEPVWSTSNESELLWRPFQLAFVMMSLPSTSDRFHQERDIFDLIWFPTGGGKTEAYLLLTAYTLILRRLRNEPSSSEGVSVIMRYTLRTLTIQQFQRAASMITACEYLRATKYKTVLGDHKFSIGLWVGKDSTPNYLNDARLALNDSFEPTSTPKQVTSCPHCLSDKSLEWNTSDQNKITISCSNEKCRTIYPFNDLPIITVDELIYEHVPSMLISTVDKFAQIVRNKKTGKIFGFGNTFLPPDLIIQDELHLISGPLGSMTGLYETAIDELCRTEEGPVKIIGSTATIRRANDQVKSLFNRRAFQFPPAALDAENSGFATLDKTAQGRLYIGLSTAGKTAKFALQATAASLLQSGRKGQAEIDKLTYYETLVLYFNSLKELGGALVIMQDDVPDSIKIFSSKRSELPRTISLPEELTSRKSSKEIPEILSKLEKNSESDEFIDILLASNMLSVGVDIPRLGLMLVNGQPKSISEYIQATSRVGRKAEGPGLVLTLFNDAKIRDKAHFETFKSWHSALYRSVEATSVTPFASRARDKALHAPLVAIALQKLQIRARPSDEVISKIKNEIFPIFEQRVKNIDQREVTAALEELSDFLEYWKERSDLKFIWNDQSPNRSLLISAEKAAARIQSGRSSYKAKPTPNSVRNVEPSTLFKIKERVYSEVKVEK